MADNQSDSDVSATELTDTLDRRKFIAISGGVSATVLAGCSSEPPSTEGDVDTAGDSSGEGTDGSTDSSANFRLLISDRPADIDDFDSLNVSFSHARIFDGETADSDDEASEGDDTETTEGEDVEATDDEETTADNQTEGGEVVEDEEEEGGDSTENEQEEGEEGDEQGVERGQGFYRLDLEGRTVDLTRVVGDAAEPVFEGSLSPGTYEKIELHVSDIGGVVDGEQAEVKVPSNKLQITHSFEITESEGVDFVFDINVVQRGNRNSYNLTPVISESGVAGKDVDVEEGDDGDEDTAESETEGDGEDSADSSDFDEDGAGDEADSPAGNDTETAGETPQDSSG